MAWFSIPLIVLWLCSADASVLKSEDYAHDLSWTADATSVTAESLSAWITKSMAIDMPTKVQRALFAIDTALLRARTGQACARTCVRAH